MKKMAVALTASVALFLSFSAIAAAASMNPGSLCERFPSLADRFPSCRDTSPPPPADVCPNVPGNQSSRPCADAQCEEQGGTWTGTVCELPPPSPPPPSSGGGDDRGNRCDRYLLTSRDTPPQSCDICPNVPGVQLTGECADKLCIDDGGLWDGTSCIDFCPNVPGYQSSGPCADQQCSDQGRVWNGNSCELHFVRITHPNGGEAFTIGDPVVIRWEASRMDSCTLIQSPGGGGGLVIANVDSFAGSYNWIADPYGKAVPDDKQKIFLRCINYSSGIFEDGSDDFFTVSPIPQCADGIDNDLDSKTDYPEDPNCLSTGDHSETYPVEILAEPLDSPGTLFQSGWGVFTIAVTDEPILLGPISFTITTTGMDAVERFINVWLEDRVFPPKVLAGPTNVQLVDGIGRITFISPMLLGTGRWRIMFRATIPVEDRSKVSSGATIHVTAHPASNWTAVGATSGTAISLISIPLLDMGSLSVVGPPTSDAQDACGDALDNDGNGKIDYPADPGCSHPNDDDESGFESGGGGGGGGGGGSN